jgi:hypothetical protein
MQNEATATTAQSSSGNMYFNVEEKLLDFGADARAKRAEPLGQGLRPLISLHTFGT